MISSRRYPTLCLLVTLIGLTCAGCLHKGQPPPKPMPALPALPALADDPQFLSDLRQASGNRPMGIRIVAPSSGPKGESRARAYALTQKLRLHFPETALNDGPVPYNANADAVRLQLLSEALSDPGAEIIWALRGGYGSSRLLEDLSRLTLKKLPPKVLVGYSDTTFLHLFLQRQGWRTVHGALLWEMLDPGKDEDNFRRLAALLAGRTTELRYQGLEPRNRAARELRAPVNAALTGGNLTCVAAAVGTPWAPQPLGKILFLEDVKEPGYKIDRMLTQLRQAGLLRGVKAVILGSFSSGDEFTSYALDRFAQSCPAPVFASNLFGHDPKNYPLVFNAPARLGKSADGTGELRIRADLRGKK